jgi:hypothetical protein
VVGSGCVCDLSYKTPYDSHMTLIYRKWVITEFVFYGISIAYEKYIKDQNNFNKDTGWNYNNFLCILKVIFFKIKIYAVDMHT